MKKFWYLGIGHGRFRFFYSEQGIIYFLLQFEQKWCVAAGLIVDVRDGPEFDSLELMYEYFVDKKDAGLIAAFEKRFL